MYEKSLLCYQRSDLLQRRSNGSRHSEPLDVQVAANFHRLAWKTRVDEIIGGALDEESILRLGGEDLLDAFLL